jgi:hypothetical protein
MRQAEPVARQRTHTLGGQVIVVRKLLAFACALGAVYSALAALSTALSLPGIEDTIRRNREIASVFDAGAQFVDHFRHSYGRLPIVEFQEWVNAQQGHLSDARFLSIHTTRFPAEIRNRFGTAPQSSYVLSYWRGEWFEYYASWTEGSTLSFDVSDYYPFGSQALGTVIASLIGILLAGAAWVTWPRPLNALTDARRR